MNQTRFATLPTSVEKVALAETDRLAQLLAAKGEQGGQLDVYWDAWQERFRRVGLGYFASDSRVVTCGSAGRIWHDQMHSSRQMIALTGVWSTG